MPPLKTEEATKSPTSTTLEQHFIRVNSKDPEAYSDARSDQIALVSSQEILNLQEKYKHFFDPRIFTNTRTVFAGPDFPLKVTWVREPTSYIQRLGGDTTHHDELVTRGYKPLKLTSKITVTKQGGKETRARNVELRDLIVIGPEALSIGIPRDRPFVSQMWQQHKIKIPPLAPHLTDKLGFLYPLIINEKDYIITGEYRLWGVDANIAARFESVIDSGMLLTVSSMTSPIASEAIKVLGASPDRATKEIVLEATPDDMSALQAFVDGTLTEQ